MIAGKAGAYPSEVPVLAFSLRLTPFKLVFIEVISSYVQNQHMFKMSCLLRFCYFCPIFEAIFLLCHNIQHNDTQHKWN